MVLLMAESNPICRRCGKCCYMRYNGKEKKCPYLIVLDERTICRIYTQKQRIGTVIGEIDGHKFKCLLRETLKQNFDKCPYNKPIEELIKDG